MGGGGECVMGGGGEMYGIVTLMYLQLQEYHGLMTNFLVSKLNLTKPCNVPQEYLEMGLEYELWCFRLQ